MIVNNKNDFELLTNSEKEEFKKLLSFGINKWKWNGEDWVLIEVTSQIEKFGFTLSDFDDIPTPKKPTDPPVDNLSPTGV